MSHVRQQLRERFVQVILAANTAAGMNVKKNTVANVSAKSCPFINVRTPGDLGAFTVIHNTKQQREIAVDVHGYLAASDSVDDDLDDLAAQVEAAITAAGHLSLGIGVLTYEGTSLEFDDVGPGEVGSFRIRYTAKAITSGPETFAGV